MHDDWQPSPVLVDEPGEWDPGMGPRLSVRPAYPRRTAAQAQNQLERFASQHQLDPEELWQEFNTFYATVDDGLDDALTNFLGSKRLSSMQVTIQADSDAAEATQRLLAQHMGRAYENYITSMLTSPELPSLLMDDQPKGPDLCYRCAQDHGSRPCRSTKRRRHR